MKNFIILNLILLFLSGCVVRDNFSLVAALANETVAINAAPVDYYYVTRVVDGDTIDVKIMNKIERVRFLGINAPESVAPKRPIECYGLESSLKLKNSLTNKLVRLESDQSQGDRDKFGRLLRYVFDETGKNYNLELVKTGAAFEFTYKKPYKYQKQFRQAQIVAQNSQSGLWASSTCAKQYGYKKIQGVCTIKGNISSDHQRYYFLPSCSDYKKITINIRTGEKYFCSEKEAIQNGFKKSLSCK
ncbi:MAG: thermonuclease family protein [bacterium]